MTGIYKYNKLKTFEELLIGFNVVYVSGNYVAPIKYKHKSSEYPYGEIIEHIVKL